MERFVFPQWIDRARPLAGGLLVVVPVYLVSILYYGGSPQTTDVGYSPKQPVTISHAQHAGELGMDCRYCHNTVEHAAHAAIPPTQTCMNCHSMVRSASEKVIPTQHSYVTGMPVEWIRVHEQVDSATQI